MYLHHVEHGIGQAVLLIHAFPLNHTMWEPQIAALQERFRVIAPDMRGFGRTPANSPWSMEDAAADLADLLDSLEIQECAVVGLSMGGYISYSFYAAYPNRIRRLVLADTRARADNEAEKNGRTDMIADLAQAGTANLPDRVLSRLLRPNTPADIVHKVRKIVETTTATGATFALMAMRDRPDSSTLLHKISCPVLVLAGDADVITQTDECRKMAETVHDGAFVNIPNAGHLSNLENPTAFSQALLDFLDRA